MNNRCIHKGVTEKRRVVYDGTDSEAAVADGSYETTVERIDERFVTLAATADSAPGFIVADNEDFPDDGVREGDRVTVEIEGETITDVVR